MESVKVLRAKIVSCLTCPLCNNLLEDATTISECLHSFCRECIHIKLSDDDAQSCPICDVYLGVAPLEKLRADPQLDDVRNKLFTPSLASQRRAAGESPPRFKRKERSLSSLGLYSAPSTARARRPRPTPIYTRTSTRDISSSELEEDEEDIRSLSSDSGDLRPSREDKGKSVADIQTPLEYLAELAEDDAGRSNEPSSSAVVKADSSPVNKEYSKLTKRKTTARKRSTTTTSSAVTEAPVKPPAPVWFALKPADNLPAETNLPAISTPYLRIPDGRLPVSVVKKYIATKLDLKSESEVEVTCRGQPIVSSLPLEKVQNIWTAIKQPSNEKPTDPTLHHILMTLTYGRKQS